MRERQSRQPGGAGVKPLRINDMPTLRRKMIAHALRAHQTDSSTHAARVAAQMQEATLFWVSADMAQVAMDASHDVPEIRAADAPTPSGLLLFENPLPPLPVQDDTGGILRQGQHMDDQLYAATMQRLSALPVVGVQWTRPKPGVLEISALADMRQIKAAGLGGDDHPLPALTAVSLPADGTLDFASALGNRTPEVIAFAALVEATWVLMMTPTAAARSLIDAGTGRQPRGYSPPRAREVTRVDLRPLHHVSTELGETDARGRVFRHRWVVRGHWRNQAHGPKRAQRRLTWVPSYVKGPDDAPLLLTEKVMVWRR